MSLSKETALFNVTQARLHAQVAFQLYLDNGLTDTAYAQYLRADCKASVLKDAYTDCGIITWEDITKLPTYSISQTTTD